MIWKTKTKHLKINDSSWLMGILNVTPDSFSDGGENVQLDLAVSRAQQMMAEGAKIIDIGGESTRPGAEPVSLDEELARTIPVIEALVARQPDVVISIDTSKAEVARQALLAGAEIVNDVTGLLGDENMADVCIQLGAGVCLMHMQGNPKTMQASPQYDDVVAELAGYFSARHDQLVARGMDAQCLCFDPGIGFGKTDEHNIALLKNINQLGVHDRPVLLGISRKSLFGRLLGADKIDDRIVPTVAMTLAAHQRGVRLHRVHDVMANASALKMWQLVE
ncbi:dihydropteroate synthase [Persicirhabdus sediminis]|uniref:Dihydropteroate synthase n=1 Tax=Persicirhabdus sediminis TaxID=454144 RepID=A0A8J7MBW0_9BACT|nr:dihydropteroate synthase [Persicirhabdus sediminis]MBK1790193.1 dihydropteroate synthase [Persicirhabdus sediminis]